MELLSSTYSSTVFTLLYSYTRTRVPSDVEVENFLKGSLDLIQLPPISAKIQIKGGKVN